MAKTLAQIADDVARQHGEEYSDLDVQELYDGWVIEALHEILSDTQWGFSKQDTTITSVASQEEYSLALGTGEVTAIWRTTGMVRELELRSKEQLIDEGKDMTITGEPQYWYPHGMSSDQKVIGLYPLPASSSVSYSVRYTLDPSQLARTSTFPLPEDFIPAVKNFLRKQYKDSAGDYNGSDRAGVAFATSIRRLKSKYNSPVAAKLQFRNSDIPERGMINHLRFPDTIT